MKLRPLANTDTAALTELLTSEPVKRTYMLPDFPNREAAIPLAERLTALSRDASHFVRGMEEEGCLVGFLNDVEIRDTTVELGYVVHPAHWGKSYATAALKLALTELFQQGFTTVLCGAFEENPASIRVMEKAGMQKLAKTDEIDYRGRLHRCVYYALTRHD